MEEPLLRETLLGESTKDEADKGGKPDRVPSARALSLAFMKSLSGLCCDDCKKDPFHLNGDDGHKKEVDHENSSGSAMIAHEPSELYNLPALRRSLSTISPFVSGPMLLDKADPHSLSGGPATLESIVGEYMCSCRFYQVPYNAGVLTTLRFSLPCLRVSGSFHDADMLALVEVLLRHANGCLKFITRLDFTVASKEGRHVRNSKLLGFTSHGAFALAKALQGTKNIGQVLLPRHRIGPYGASAIFMACRMNPTIEALNLRRCRIGRRGAYAFCQIILGVTPDGEEVPVMGDKSELAVKSSTGHGLIDMDLSANTIGHAGTVAIESSLKEFNLKTREGHALVVNLDGNLVFPEIMNGVTHGVGVLLSLLGGYLLSQRVTNASLTHIVSCGIYTLSLLALYLSSTLYHSMFAMVNTRAVFRVMDKCAIYILIAGSYTPFLQILLFDEPAYSYGMLGFLWLCGGLGISVEAMYPSWKWKGTFSLSMYLAMGWSALVCLPEMRDRLPLECVYLLFLGGVGYTAGVPFFIRDNNLDHAIWHLFVLSGSIFHWFGVYLYVAPKTLL